MIDQKTIILVDDEEEMVDVLAKNLADIGYKVVTASDGEEALNLLDSIKPDLIILDVNMPNMGGIKFYHTVADDKGQAPFPIIFLTERAELKDLVVNEWDAVGFISKPFRIAELSEKILEVLSKNKQ